ncbi:MAG TPA: LysR family transcriptional regulator, partial [Candidatus Merdisoma faecalis]|nr:LysR family transcriptional regulator [Candidatus Merdisoma faecalis]
MLLRQMKYFAAVVECGSFTEAAEQCYISQSAISQQIRTLEKELGVELLHRGN